MGYTIPDWKKSIDQNKFEVTTEDGIFLMPKAEYLTGRQTQLLESADEVEGGIYAVLDDICDGLGTALLDVPVKFVKEMVESWQEDSGISLGESEASAS